ncbi:Receptor protein kinase [Spatholobus suberectus]|nr:Receptor protein kinase [Spatholobus suberectus]
MKALLLHPCFIFILLVISTNIPTFLCEDDIHYTNCSNAFSCGSSSTSNLKYPFWGENRDKYCGGPDMEKLTCESGVPKINISSIKYRILDWDDTAYILTVARDDYWDDNDVCVNDPKNNTFDNTPFQYDYGVLLNVTLFYDCNPNSPPTIPANPSTPFSITCAGGKVVYYTAVTLPSSYEVPCTVVVIPIFQSNAKLISNKTVSDALNGGFELNWTGNNEQCKTCTGSGGECGLNGGEFQCFCRNGPQNTSCPVSDSGMLASLVISQTLMPISISSLVSKHLNFVPVKSFNQSFKKRSATMILVATSRYYFSCPRLQHDCDCDRIDCI